MATKKPTTKKTAVKTPAKKAPTKKPAAKKSAAKTAKTTDKNRSFRVSSDEKFFTPRVTLQTVYWSIFAIAVLLLFIWVLNVQLDIIEQLDRIANEQ